MAKQAPYAGALPGRGCVCCLVWMDCVPAGVFHRRSSPGVFIREVTADEEVGHLNGTPS